MSELAMDPNRVDLYVRGKLNAEEIMAFEAELLESPKLQEALEEVLSLQRVVDIDQQLSEAGEFDEPVTDVSQGWYTLDGARWPVAASITLAAGAVLFLWHAEVENTQLQSQISALSQPVGRVLTVPLDIMRSTGSQTPDVRIRKMPGPALLVLDVEVTSRMANSPELQVELHGDKGDELAVWSANPGPEGRIQLAFRSDHLPDGLVSLVIRDPQSGAREDRLLELLPAE